jgi:hypothetical protein
MELVESMEIFTLELMEGRGGTPSELPSKTFIKNLHQKPASKTSPRNLKQNPNQKPQPRTSTKNLHQRRPWRQSI